MFGFVRLCFAAAIAVTFGYTWTVGQGGLKQVNTNLCDLWRSLPIPEYQACEFQYALVIVWILTASAAGVWLIFEIANLIGRIKLRRARLLAHFLFAGFFVAGAAISLALLVADFRNGTAPSSPPSEQPNKELSEKFSHRFRFSGFETTFDEQKKGTQFGFVFQNSLDAPLRYEVEEISIVIGGIRIAKPIFDNMGTIVAPKAQTTFYYPRMDFHKKDAPAEGTARIIYKFGPPAGPFVRRATYKLSMTIGPNNTRWNTIEDTEENVTAGPDTKKKSSLELEFPEEANSDGVESLYKRSWTPINRDGGDRRRVSVHRFFIGVTNTASDKTLRNVRVVMQSLTLGIGQILNLNCLCDRTQKDTADIPPTGMDYFLIGEGIDESDAGMFHIRWMNAQEYAEFSATLEKQKHRGFLLLPANTNPKELLKNDGYILNVTAYADDVSPAHSKIIINAKSRVEILLRPNGTSDGA